MRKGSSDGYVNKYPIEVQALYLNYLIGNKDIFQICRAILSADYFDEKLRPAVRFIMDYTDEYKAIPSIEQVRVMCGVTVEKPTENSPEHRKWLLDEVQGFCRRKAIELAILDSPDLLEKEQEAEIEERIREAMEISVMTDLGTDYFGDPLARLERMREKTVMISTGWQTLDHKLYGGVSRGTLTVLAGASGTGKSLLLQNMALNWVFLGLNVVYFSLELSEELISQRLDAMVTGRSTRNVFVQYEEVAESVIKQSQKAGKLQIKKLPEGGTTANDLRAYLKQYELETGIKPDVVIVDYLDLMYPINKRIDPSDMFVKDKYTSEELRGLACDLDVICATASQLNRQSIAANGEFDQSHIAGGISKINTADNVFAIYSTLAMKERGVYQLIFLKTRTAAAVGQTIDLAYDPVSMRITDQKIIEDNPERQKGFNSLRAELSAKTAKSKDNGSKTATAAKDDVAEPVETKPTVMELVARLKKTRQTVT